MTARAFRRTYVFMLLVALTTTAWVMPAQARSTQGDTHVSVKRAIGGRANAAEWHAPLRAFVSQAQATPTPAPTKDIVGTVSLVTPTVKLEPENSAATDLAPNTLSDLQAGTRITVTERGKALLGFPPALLVELFRDVGLQRLGMADPNAPFILRLQLYAGAIFGRETPQIAAESRISVEVTTGWALIVPNGTEFWVYFNPQNQFTWVIVREGSVDVTAAGTTVTVLARQQTWVEPTRPPVRPIPAQRALIGSLFPLIDELTNGDYVDADFLEPAPATLTPTPTPTSTPRRATRPRVTPRLVAVATTPAPPPSAPQAAPPSPTSSPPPPASSSVSMGYKPIPVPYGGTAQVWWVIPSNVFRSGSFDSGDGRGFVGPVDYRMVVDIPKMTASRTVRLRWQDVNGAFHEQAVFIEVSPPSSTTEPPPVTSTPTTPTPTTPTPTVPTPTTSTPTDIPTPTPTDTPTPTETSCPISCP